MHYKAILWILRIVALTALLGVLYFVFYTSPYKNQDITVLIGWNVIIFEVLLFVFLSAFFSIFLFWIRRVGKRGLVKNPEMCFLAIISIRQGILLGLGMMLLLILQSFNILTWWVGLLSIGGILMIELYFLVK